jgi:hypothetical protein
MQWPLSGVGPAELLIEPPSAIALKLQCLPHMTPRWNHGSEPHKAVRRLPTSVAAFQIPPPPWLTPLVPGNALVGA